MTKALLFSASIYDRSALEKMSDVELERLAMSDEDNEALIYDLQELQDAVNFEDLTLANDFLYFINK